MTDQKILVPVDLSEITEKVVEMAVYIARKNNMTICLLHIENKKSSNGPEEKLEGILSSFKSSTVQFEYLVKQGNIFEEITKAAKDVSFKLMVIGSHGFKGIREKVFGADILKLLKNICIPVISVQKNFEIPENGFGAILFPTGSHSYFGNKIEATIYFARLFGSEVHLYSVEKPGTEWSEEIINNIRKAQDDFENAGIPFNRVKETQNSFSIGYAKQIMDYAKRANIDLIALMANPTKEHFYIADSDKETILTNPEQIPVLSTNDKSLLNS